MRRRCCREWNRRRSCRGRDRWWYPSCVGRYVFASLCYTWYCVRMYVVRQVNLFHGGESAALWRVHEYFWKNDQLTVYKRYRNGMLGPKYNSLLACFGQSFAVLYLSRGNDIWEAKRIKWFHILGIIWTDMGGYFRFLFSKIWELHFLARVTIASTLLYAWNWELWNSAMRYWTSRYRDTYHWWSAANTRNVRYIHTLSWSMVNPPLAYHKLLVNYQIKRKC